MNSGVVDTLLALGEENYRVVAFVAFVVAAWMEESEEERERRKPKEDDLVVWLLH